MSQGRRPPGAGKGKRRRPPGLQRERGPAQAWIQPETPQTPDSRNGREETGVVLAAKFAVICYGSPRKLSGSIASLEHGDGEAKDSREPDACSSSAQTPHALRHHLQNTGAGEDYQEDLEFRDGKSRALDQAQCPWQPPGVHLLIRAPHHSSRALALSVSGKIKLVQACWCMHICRHTLYTWAHTPCTNVHTGIMHTCTVHTQCPRPRGCRATGGTSAPAHLRPLVSHRGSERMAPTWPSCSACHSPPAASSASACWTRCSTRSAGKRQQEGGAWVGPPSCPRLFSLIPVLNDRTPSE